MSKVRFKHASFYGSLESATAASEIILQVYLFEFYVRGLGLDALLAGSAIFIVALLDGCWDLATGWISDRWQSRLGKRLPFILSGAPVLALAVPLLFAPFWHGQGQAVLFLALLLNYALASLALTSVVVPYSSMGGEIARDSNGRNLLYAARFLFGNVGLLAATLAPALAAQNGADFVTSRFLAAGLVTVLVILTLYFPVRLKQPAPASNAIGQPESSQAGRLKPTDLNSRPDNAQKSSHPAGLTRGLLTQLKALLSGRNRPFKVLLLAFLTAGVARSVNAALAMFYYKDYLGLPEADVIGLVFMLFFVFLIVGIFIWLRAVRSLGYSRTLGGAVFGLGAMTIGYTFLPPGHSLAMVVSMAVAGGLLAAAILLIDSLLSEMADLDHLKSGIERRGLMFGTLRMSYKFSRAGGFLAGGALLALYEQGHRFVLPLGFGLLVGTLFIVSAVLIYSLQWNNTVSDRVARLQQKFKHKEKSLTEAKAA